jgi:hypothetical protein
MKKNIVILFVFIVVTMQISGCLFNSGVEQNLNAEEVLIYSIIVDSVFNDTYKTIFIDDSTRSLIRFITKSTFSENLFGEEPVEYFKSFFEKKKCDVKKILIKDYVKNNRSKYFLRKNFIPKREHRYLPYRSIYLYKYQKIKKQNELFEAIKNGAKFGIISFSRIGFNSRKTEALIEVHIHRERRGENFFIILKKVNTTWKPVSNCYIYGPYSVQD